MSVIDKAIDWALAIANDFTHGYDQASRWGPDYDCSSFVISAYKAAGLPLTATYTGNMRQDFLNNGFVDAATLGVVELNMGAGLRRGDVLLNDQHHTAIYLGNGTVIQASINEHGKIKGGAPGDQTGSEIGISYYRNYPWNIALRYVGDDAAVSNLDRAACARGERSSRVKKVQALLIYFHGISCGPDGVDGDFGPNTSAAVVTFQLLHGLEPDGIVGDQTAAKLLEVTL